MNHIAGRLADELYVRATGRFVEGKTELDLLSDSAIVKLFKGRAKRAITVNNYPPLTKAEEDKVREYYRGCPHFSMLYHRIYKGRTGHLDVEYMPDDLYYGCIETYYNDREAARYIDNKALYYSLFKGASLPERICMRVGGLWFDGEGEPVNKREIPDLVRRAGRDGELVLKIAENSEGGAGVFFLDAADPAGDFRRKMCRIPHDVVVQRAIVAHPDLRKLHPESTNTIRLMSFLTPDGVRILTTCVRVGAGGNRTDNLSSGGLFIGIDENGRTKGLGAMHDGIVTREHPTMHYDLKGYPVPGVEKAHELARKLHPVMGRFRLASWDIAIDEAGEAILLETNVSLSVISDIQVCAGPLFGDKTREVVEDVFGL